MYRQLGLVLISSLLLPSVMVGQSLTYDSGLEVANFRTVSVAIEELPPDASRIALTVDSLRTRIQLRLSQAGLIPTFEMPFQNTRDFRLGVAVNVAGPAYSVQVALVRPVLYDVGETAHLVAVGETWQRLGVGTHGGDPERVFSSLDQVLDLFIAAYLEENSP